MIMSIPYIIYIWSWLCNENTSQSMFQDIMFTSLQGFQNWIAESIQYDKCLNARDFCSYISYDSWHVMNLYFMKLESENKYCTQTCTIVLKIIHVRYLISHCQARSTCIVTIYNVSTQVIHLYVHILYSDTSYVQMFSPTASSSLKIFCVILEKMTVKA